MKNTKTALFLCTLSLILIAKNTSAANINAQPIQQPASTEQTKSAMTPVSILRGALDFFARLVKKDEYAHSHALFTKSSARELEHIIDQVSDCIRETNETTAIFFSEDSKKRNNNITFYRKKTATVLARAEALLNKLVADKQKFVEEKERKMAHSLESLLSSHVSLLKSLGKAFANNNLLTGLMQIQGDSTAALKKIESAAREIQRIGIYPECCHKLMGMIKEAKDQEVAIGKMSLLTKMNIIRAKK